MVGADGRNRVRLTRHEEHHSGPAWSPDGGVIAYSVFDGGPGDYRGTIHLMTSHGRYIRQLSDGRNARDFEPDISPLGLAVSPDSNIRARFGVGSKNSLPTSDNLFDCLNLRFHPCSTFR